MSEGPRPSPAAALRTAVKARFLPLMVQRGFVVDRSRQPVFTTFRRQVDGRVQVCELQWDKRGSARFVVNFGEVPAHGVARQGRPVPPGEVLVFDCQPMLRLQRRRGRTLGSWFQLRRPLLRQLATLTRDDSPDAVVDALVAALPEMDAWWSTRLLGPHVQGG